MDTLLTVEQAAERLGTSERFVRRLIAERRITYVKLGRHVRIAADDLMNFIATGRVEVGPAAGWVRDEPPPVRVGAAAASGRWQARYLDAAGVRHTAPRTFPTKVEATRYLAQVEADLLRGSWADPKLGRVDVRGVGASSGGRPRSTCDRERGLLPTTCFAGSCCRRSGRSRWADLDTMTVRAWLADLHRAGEVTPTTIAKAYRLLRRILNVAVEAGYLPRNPCTVKGAGIERAAEMRHASIPQLHQLADAVPGGYRALILLAGYSGLRWAELVGLRRPPCRPGRRSGPGGRAGGRGRRQDHREPAQDGRRPAGGDAAEGGGGGAGRAPGGVRRARPGWAGVHHAEGRRSCCAVPSTAGSVWRPAVEQVGLDGLRVHDLRHTAATLAAAAGATTKELMERMGHTSPAVALRYQHVMADRQAQLASALDDLARAATAPAKGTGRARKGTQRARRRR